MKQKKMGNPSFLLQGSLNLVLDRHLVWIECEGQSIRLTFSSLNALRRFISSMKLLNKQLFPLLNNVSHLNLNFYIGNALVGEANPHLEPHWFGRYLGLEKFKFYPKQIIASLFFHSHKS